MSRPIPTVASIDAKLRALHLRWTAAKAFLDAQPGLEARIIARFQATQFTADGGEIVVSCAGCDDADFWNFPGGALLRCAWCGPTWAGGLGCLSWSECAGEGEDG